MVKTDLIYVVRCLVFYGPLKVTYYIGPIVEALIFGVDLIILSGLLYIVL